MFSKPLSPKQGRRRSTGNVWMCSTLVARLQNRCYHDLLTKSLGSLLPKRIRNRHPDITALHQAQGVYHQGEAALIKGLQIYPQVTNGRVSTARNQLLFIARLFPPVTVRRTCKLGVRELLQAGHRTSTNPATANRSYSVSRTRRSEQTLCCAV